jgi:hypothetical protein
MSAKTYARRFGKDKQQQVTVERLPGLVIESSSDDVRGAGPVRRHPTSSVRRTAREIERRLRAAGYTPQDGAA